MKSSLLNRPSVFARSQRIGHVRRCTGLLTGPDFLTREVAPIRQHPQVLDLCRRLETALRKATLDELEQLKETGAGLDLRGLRLHDLLRTAVTYSIRAGHELIDIALS